MARKALSISEVEEAKARDVQPGRKAAQILIAAADQFLANGYDCVTMDLVAAAATVSKATLYAYFKTKRDLFAAVVDEEAQRINEAICSPGDGGDDVEAVLTLIGKNFVAVFLTERAIAVRRMVVGALPHFPEIAGIVMDAGPAKMAAKIEAFLASASENGRLDVDDADVAARQFMALIRSDLDLFGLSARPRRSKAEIDKGIEAAIRTFLARYGKR